MKTTNLKKLGVTLFAVSALGVVANVVPAVGVLNPVVVHAEDQTTQIIVGQDIIYNTNTGNFGNGQWNRYEVSPSETFKVPVTNYSGYTYSGYIDSVLSADAVNISQQDLLNAYNNRNTEAPVSSPSDLEDTPLGVNRKSYTLFYTPATEDNNNGATEAPKDQSADPDDNDNADTGGGVTDGSNNGTVTPPADNSNGSDNSTATPPSDNTGGGTTGDSTVTPPAEQPKADAGNTPAPAPAPAETPKAETSAPAQKQEAVKPKEVAAQAPKKTLPQTGESASVLSISLGTLTLGLVGLILGKGRYQARHEK